MTKRNEFNAKKSKALKDEGIERVKVNNMQWVMKARAVAIREAKRKGWVTSDDVQKICPRPKETPANAVGAIFKTDALTPTGFIQSIRVSAHHRWIRVWEYAY